MARPGVPPRPGRTQPDSVCFCRKGKWVRLFGISRGVLVLSQALVAMEMETSVCGACSWTEFQNWAEQEWQESPGESGPGALPLGGKALLGEWEQQLRALPIW